MQVETRICLLHDISPVAVDGVIRVGGNKHNGYYQNWIDIYDVTDPNEPNSNKAVHTVCTKMVHKQLELDYELGYYSDSSVPEVFLVLLGLAQTSSSKQNTMNLILYPI